MLDSIQHIATDSLALINAAGVDLPTIPRVTNWGTSPLIGSTLLVLFLLYSIGKYNPSRKVHLKLQLVLNKDYYYDILKQKCYMK